MNEKMKRYLVTFGQKYAQEDHPVSPALHPDAYLEVYAMDEEYARGKVIRALGVNWAFMYPEADFTASYYPRGLVGTIAEDGTRIEWILPTRLEVEQWVNTLTNEANLSMTFAGYDPHERDLFQDLAGMAFAAGRKFGRSEIRSAEDEDIRDAWNQTGVGGVRDLVWDRLDDGEKSVLRSFATNFLGQDDE